MAQLKDLIVNGNTRLIGDAYASTPAVADDSNKVATTEWVKDQGYTTTSGTVTTTGTMTSGHVVVSNGGSVIKDGTYTIATSVPSGAVFTDTKVTAVGNHYTPSGGTATTPTSSGTATRGSTVVMTGITKDAAGHVTGVTGYTLPASDNVDTKVKQTLITTNGDYPVILKNNTTATDSPTDVTNYAAAVKVNPSSGTLTANKVVGGVWNDYAEYRKCDFKEPGYVVCENGNGKLEVSTKKLQACPYVISDTFGFAIGEKENGVPVATGGRALVHVCGNREDYKVGDVLCAGANGAAAKMSRRQIGKYPDRILGIVCEIPSYETWGGNNIKVNNRVWIKVI